MPSPKTCVSHIFGKNAMQNAGFFCLFVFVLFWFFLGCSVVLLFFGVVVVFSSFVSINKPCEIQILFHLYECYGCGCRVRVCMTHLLPLRLHFFLTTKNRKKNVQRVGSCSKRKSTYNARA